MSVVDAVRVEEQQIVSMASIAAHRGVSATTIGTAIGMKMPSDRKWTAGDAMVMMTSGPGMWLAQQHDAPATWSSELERRLAGLASVSDQTGAYRVFRIEGSGARTLLQRGVAIDLHDSAFPAGSVAATAIAHIDVVVRCLEAGNAYEAAVYRSYTASLLRWLDATRAGMVS